MEQVNNTYLDSNNNTDVLLWLTLMDIAENVEPVKLTVFDTFSTIKLVSDKTTTTYFMDNTDAKNIDKAH